MNDTYLTIKKPSEGIYKEKGSKFLAFAYPLFSEQEFKNQLQELKKAYRDARHHCYAFKIGLDGALYRHSDDGEPNNSAGKPIFGQIQSFQLTNIAIVVVRYFGGTKLGVGGLVTAYKEAAKDALTNATIIEKTVNNFFQINFGYDIMSDVMNLLKNSNVEIIKQNFEENCQILFSIRQTESEKIQQLLTKMSNLEIVLTKTA